MAETSLTLQPLERLPTAPADENRRGANRAAPGTPRLIDADNDLAAVKLWLAEFHDSPNTFRNYRKEVERLLLWARHERGKPLSDLSREDLKAYELFLEDPQPAQRWCGPRRPREAADWRPFQGPLSAPSRRQALVIINALFMYLVDAGYWSANPLTLMRRRLKKLNAAVLKTVERFLDQAQWRELFEFVEQQPRETSKQHAGYERLRYLLSLLYLLGPRVSEIAGSTMGNFVERRGKWWWTVTGKGGKTETIPANSEVLEALMRYRQFHRLSPLPAPGEQTPLVMTLYGPGGITSNMIYRIVKDVMRQLADAVEATNPGHAQKYRAVSTHWFRHTAITHQADAGIELRYLNKSARHSKLETTAVYLHAEEEQWHRAMERHSSRPKSDGKDVSDGGSNEPSERNTNDDGNRFP